jgi:hypothetical protein
MHACNSISSLNIRREEKEERYEEKNKKRVTRRKDPKTVKKDKTKKLGCMVALYTLILTPMDQKGLAP